jgi:Domain of unknown function (DUF4249)
VNQKIKLGIGLTMLLGFIACQEVIEVPLKDPSPIFIIEAILSDQPELGSSYVQITKNTDYSSLDPTAFGVSGASITITDNLGNRDSLFEVPPSAIGGLKGFYGKFGMQGVLGRTYTLNVQVEGKTFTAVSTMPAHHTNIDSLTSKRNEFAGNNNNNPDPTVDTSANEIVTIHFKDKPNVVEHFRIQTSRRNPKNLLPIAETQYIMRSNERLFRDAEYHHTPFFILNFAKGDTATFRLWNMDAKVYDYFNTLQEVTGNAFATPAAPANPNTNIKGGAQGYFAVVSEARKVIIVK